MSNKIPWTLINDETGEIINAGSLNKKEKRNIITKSIVDYMLNNSKKLEDIDIELLYKWLKITKEINEFGQIKIIGSQREEALEKKLIEDATILLYTYRILYNTHPFNCSVMLNQRTKIKSWGELWNLIGCTKRSSQQKVKKFLIENNLLREIVITCKNKKMKQFYLNPFLLRRSQYSSQVALNVFQDCAKEGVNINFYAYLFLQCTGIFEIEK